LNKFLYIFVFAFASGFAQETMSVEEAVKIALEKNYNVVIAKNQKEISKAQNNIGAAGMSPSVSLNASYNFANVNSHQEFTGGTTQDRTGAASNNLAASANVNWIIFDGMKMFAVKKRLGLNEGLSDLNLRQQMENTVYSTILAYYDIVRIRSLINSQNQNLTVYAERKKIASVKLEAGSDSKVDLLTSSTDENKAKSDLLQLELQLLNARSTLNNLLLKPVDNDLKITDTIVSNYEPNIDDLKKTSEKNSLLLISKQNELILNETISEARSANLPFIGVNAAYNFTQLNSQAGFLFKSQQNGIAAGLSASWLIFNGNRNNRLVKERQILMLNQRVSGEQIKQNVDALVYVNYQAFLTNKKIVELEKQNLTDAKELVFIAMERYRIGKSSLIETKEAQRTLEESQVRFINALYNLKKAETELLRANGGLVR
jgi:outer membrane protein